MTDLAKKIHEMMAQPTLASFATITEEGKPWVRFVVVKADEELNLFFATFAGSRKVNQIAANPEVHLTIGAGDMENPHPYLQIQGTADVFTDAASKQAFWYDYLTQIFSGPDDPIYVVCKVTPYRIEYTHPAAGLRPEVWEPKA